MLGRLRMSVQECIDEYTILSKEIFSERKTGSSEMFYAENLEKAIKKVVRKKLGEHAGDAPLQDPLAEEACKALVFLLPLHVLPVYLTSELIGLFTHCEGNMQIQLRPKRFVPTNPKIQ